MGSTQPAPAPRSRIDLVAGVCGGALFAFFSASAIGPNGSGWGGTAFGWLLLLLPFAVAAFVARRRRVPIVRSLVRCSLAFGATVMAPFVVLAVIYALFG